jgi:hypothetical protein
VRGAPSSFVALTCNLSHVHDLDAPPLGHSESSHWRTCYLYSHYLAQVTKHTALLATTPGKRGLPPRAEACPRHVRVRAGTHGQAAAAALRRQGSTCPEADDGHAAPARACFEGPNGPRPRRSVTVDANALRARVVVLQVVQVSRPQGRTGQRLGRDVQIKAKRSALPPPHPSQSLGRDVPHSALPPPNPYPSRAGVVRARSPSRGSGSRWVVL